MEPIYFDYASTTPVDPRVMEAMQPYLFARFGNPASPHAFGREAKKAMEDARQSIAQAIGAQEEEIIFNSGATEGSNHALFGIARSLRDKGKHIVISAIEHHAIDAPASYLAAEGYKITYLPVNREGVVDPQEVKKALTDETILLAVMHANNEIGTIQPVKAIGAIAREKGVPFLVDAVQTVGHIPVNVDDLGADLLTMSAHKFYGPKSVGALYVRRKTRIAPFLLGGDQEKGRRASTQNPAGAVGMARALQLCLESMPQEIATQTRLRDKLLEEVPRRIEGVIINGDRKARLPNNSHFSFEGIAGESLLISLDMQGICASMGSACKAGAMEPSRILVSIGLSDELAHGALRVSIGRWTTQAHIDYLLEQLPAAVKSLRV